MPRALLLTAALLCAGCAGTTPPPRPLVFAPAPVWKTLLGDFVVAPLASGGPRLFVATRDGAVRGLDRLTGAVLWTAADLPGTLAATDGALIVRSAGGRVTSLHPRNGGVRWSVETGIAGPLPVVLDEDRLVVAGQGLAALDLASGRTLFEDRAAEITAPPVPLPRAAMLLTAEADGILRCRDRLSGIPIWTRSTTRSLVAPPLVDRSSGFLYLGTREKRIQAATLANGRLGWRWTVGADVAHPGLLSHGKILFAPHDAVLYALHRNGHLAWRSPLPSRPLSGPLPAGGHLLVACLEDLLLLIDAETGEKLAELKTSAEIRTPPLVLEDLVAIGLRDRSVVAYALPGAPARPAAAGATVVPPEGAR